MNDTAIKYENNINKSAEKFHSNENQTAKLASRYRKESQSISKNS